MMKKVPKKLFDEFLQETRKHWLDEADYETTLLLTKELQIKTNVQWIAWKDFINSFYIHKVLQWQLLTSRFMKSLKFSVGR
mgnify:CR=1 FL=1